MLSYKNLYLWPQSTGLVNRARLAVRSLFVFPVRTGYTHPITLPTVFFTSCWIWDRVCDASYMVISVTLCHNQIEVQYSQTLACPKWIFLHENILKDLSPTSKSFCLLLKRRGKELLSKNTTFPQCSGVTPIFTQGTWKIFNPGDGKDWISFGPWHVGVQVRETKSERVAIKH